ncbi:MAG: STAS domain-containing protein [Mycobacteriales bacterium]
MDEDRQGAALLLRPTGPLDAESCGELRHQLGTAFAAGITSVAVDLRGVTSLDVTGLGVLGGAAKHLRARGGLLVVTHASAALATTLRINGLGDLLEVPPSPPLRVVPGVQKDGGPRSRRLSVVPTEGLKQPS